MEVKAFEAIIAVFDIQLENINIKPFGNGLINNTWLVGNPEDRAQCFLLQQINHRIFNDVEALINNIILVTGHIRRKIKKEGGDPEKNVLRLIPLKNGSFYYQDNEGRYWRMYHFLQDTLCYDHITDTGQAFEGGKAFGRFQSQLTDLPAGLLTPVIPDFLNMVKRLRDFEAVLNTTPSDRLVAAESLIKEIWKRADKMCFFQRAELPVRVIHNDTKFNNVLLDHEDKAQCVIDLDTVMPGYVAYDYGDALRTIINTAAEDEKDIRKIGLDIPLFEAYTRGYFQEAAGFLTEPEVDSLITGMLLLPYMQAVRFLTDYLDNDRYYKVNFPGHNLQRANAQLALLFRLEEVQPILENTIKKLFRQQTMTLQYS